MARLDVYPMPGKSGPMSDNSGHIYILDVQAELLSQLHTRAVVPLLPLADAPASIKELDPVFEIDGEPHVMVTQPIASIPAKELRGTVASLGRHHDEVTRALDILLLGF
jgi:toxin CcdB